MDENFKLLFERILDAIKSSNLEKIKDSLETVKGPVICVGSGGSNVVSEYASKIFNYKNNCLSLNLEPRDLNYLNISCVENVFICSYSGRNYGVKFSTLNDKRKYLFTNKEIESRNINLIKYNNTLQREKSFVSLAATLMPMSILLNYYLKDCDFECLLNRMFDNIENYSFENTNTFEIMSGLDTSVASTFLESTMVEAGLADCIVHKKYNYCHGRTTLAYNRVSILIYLSNGIKEIDNLILEEAKKLYKDVIILNSDYNDIIIDNFNLTLKSFFLVKYIAKLKNKDLSKVKYAPAVRKLYHFKGGM